MDYYPHIVFEKSENAFLEKYELKNIFRVNYLRSLKASIALDDDLRGKTTDKFQ